MKKQVQQGGKDERNFFLNGFHLMLAESVCIFPDTRPEDNMLFPLVQLFRQAVHLAPMENDLPEELSPLAQELLTEGALCFHCPAPLGQDRVRFLALLKDLRQRPADYAGLALTGFSAPETTESENAIIKAVRRQGSGLTEQMQTDALWQPRLLLKLAEIIEQEEEEIRQTLHRVELRQQGLLQALRDEQSAAAPALNKRPARERSHSRLRLKAWLTLLAASSEILLSHVFITSDDEAFAAIIEKSRTEPVQRVSLPLPAHPAGDNFAARRQHFRQEAADVLNTLPNSFQEAAWESFLEQHYPAAEHGRCRLSLYSLLNIFEFGGDASGQETIIGIINEEEE